MPAQNPRLRALAAQVTRTVYHQGDRVVSWRGRHCGRSGFVVQSVDATLRVRLFALDGSLQIVQDHPLIVVCKTSCCLIAENSDSDSE